MNTIEVEERLRCRNILKTLSAVPLAASVPVLADARSAHPLYFSCGENNDLYRVASSGIACWRHDRVEDAIARAPGGVGVLILADGYPLQRTGIDDRVYGDARKKRLRLYVEFPASIPDVDVGKPQHVAQGRFHNILERCVIATDSFAPALKRMRILALHDCIYVPVESRAGELVLAQLAGFDTAVYGLPKEGVHPILFRYPDRDILIAATKLSEFVKGCYAPTAAWPLDLAVGLCMVVAWAKDDSAALDARCLPSFPEGAAVA